VPVINEAFMPSRATEAARRLVERYDGARDQGVGVCVDEDGQMVDEAVVRAGRRILARARQAEGPASIEGERPVDPDLEATSRCSARSWWQG
jgi:citrate lyase beta subunit